MQIPIRLTIALSVLLIVGVGVATVAEKPAPTQSDRSIKTASSGFTLTRQVIAAGGGAGNSTNLQINGTAGQVTVGDGSSASFQLSGGFWPGTALHPDPGCCVPPLRGNIDFDPLDQIDISDLVYLVDYMFTGGPAPPCCEEADLDCNGETDISDLVCLVDYMFVGGPPPCRCDCAGEACGGPCGQHVECISGD